MRIGVLRFVDTGSAPVAALFERALDVLRAQGAILVDVAEPKDRDEIGAAEFTVLLTEFKAGLNAYLASAPAAVTTRTLAQVIAFNKANAPAEMALFGQDIFDKAEATAGLADPKYRAARALSLRLAGRDGIDAMLAANKVVVLVAPTMPPAWPIDAVNGDQIAGGGAGGLAAVAGTPHLTVPMGAVRGLPVGLSFMGPAWSEAQLLALGFAYEAASRAKVTPRFLDSVETSPEVAPLLLPASRDGRVKPR